jgi:ATP-binding cassette, subfamily C (CFTR/MRP), member 1
MTSSTFQLIKTHAIRLATLAASLSMFKAALTGVLRSPVSFFDTTPMGMLILLNLNAFLTNIHVGRIMSRFSKDQDTLDTQISMTLYQVGSIFAFNLAVSQYFGLVPFHIQLGYRNGNFL